jgi:hypothetical protein
LAYQPRIEGCVVRAIFKADPAAALEKTRSKLSGVDDNIAALRAKRAEVLLLAEDAGVVVTIDKAIEAETASAAIYRDRIKALDEECRKVTYADREKQRKQAIAKSPDPRDDRGLSVKIRWPHDGSQHDKGSGLSIRKQHVDAGANMAGSHVTNYAGGISIEPSIQEIATAMRDGKIVFNKSCEELLTEMRTYHRDIKTGKPVDKNQDLVSALCHGFMGRGLRQPLAEYTGIGYGNLAHSHRRPQRQAPQMARGIDFDVFDI